MNRGTTTWGAARYRVDFERAANANPTLGKPRGGELRGVVAARRSGRQHGAHAAGSIDCRRRPWIPDDPHPQRMLDLVKAIDDQAQGDGEAVAFQCADDHASALMAVAWFAYRRLKRGMNPASTISTTLFSTSARRCGPTATSTFSNRFTSRRWLRSTISHWRRQGGAHRQPPGARPATPLRCARIRPRRARSVAKPRRHRRRPSFRPFARTSPHCRSMPSSMPPSLLCWAEGVSIAPSTRQLERICSKPASRWAAATPATPRSPRAFLLPALYVVHTVGPKWQNGHHDEANLLASCYRRSLEEASRKGARSVAFPCISTGSYGFPAPEAAQDRGAHGDRLPDQIHVDQGGDLLLLLRQASRTLLAGTGQAASVTLQAGPSMTRQARAARRFQAPPDPGPG